MIQFAFLVCTFGQADVTVLVQEATSANTPVEKAEVWIKESALPNLETRPKQTDDKGKVVLVRPPLSEGNIFARKSGYVTASRRWPFKSPDNVIRLPKKPDRMVYQIPGEGCVRYYTVARVVVDADGRERSVYETRSRPLDCREPADLKIVLKLPEAPAPAGFKYRCVRINRWFDADLNKIRHQGIFELVPVAQGNYPRKSTQCGCG